MSLLLLLVDCTSDFVILLRSHEVGVRIYPT